MPFPTDTLMPLAMLAAVPSLVIFERRTRAAWIATAPARSSRTRAPIWILVASSLCIAKFLLAVLRVTAWSIDRMLGESGALVGWRVALGMVFGVGFAFGARAFLTRSAHGIAACVAAVVGLLALEGWDVIDPTALRDIARSVVVALESALLLAASRYVARNQWSASSSHE